jgi:hypothetical protein
VEPKGDLRQVANVPSAAGSHRQTAPAGRVYRDSMTIGMAAKQTEIILQIGGALADKSTGKEAHAETDVTQNRDDWQNRNKKSMYRKGGSNARNKGDGDKRRTDEADVSRPWARGVCAAS